jgi:hypothetical protein
VRLLSWARPEKILLDLGLFTLTLGRALHGLGTLSQGASEHQSRDGVQTAQFQLNDAVDRLREAGFTEHIPRGLLARAAFLRNIGDWAGAKRDLDEIEEIAEPGPMRLFLCDLALERSRLAFARIEAFALLYRAVAHTGLSKPSLLSHEHIAELKTEATSELAIAAEYIKQCGYHLRNDELAELEAVQRGEKRFADLSPRV